MELFPAIDLRDGRCVRLYQGDFERETVYDDDPVARAKAFAEAGARWIHVVDLDAARTGVPVNRKVVAEVVEAVPVAVQCGGGVRDEESAEALFEIGVARVVLGTAALEQPTLVAALASRHPVAVGLDARGRDVSVRGWAHGTGQDLVDVACRFDDIGVAALVVTEIGRDGTLTGPDTEGLAEVLSATSVDVVASGGVGDLEDLRVLRDLAAGPSRRQLAGAIVGRALYEGRFTVVEALDVVSGAR